MQRFLLIFPFLMACNTVTPGHVVLAVNVAADSEESRYSVIRGGRYWASINTDYYELPVMEQRAVWSASPTEGNPIDESISFAGIDGQPVNADFGIGYMLAPEDPAIIKMVRTYGLSLDQIIDGRVRDSTRNSLNICASTFSVEQLYGDKKGELMECAYQKVKSEYEPNGLLIQRLTLNSEIRLPPKVKTALESAIAASQEADRVRREVEATKAEGEKSIAAAHAEAEATRLRADAEAAANRTLAESITPQLIELKRVEAYQELAEKWNGQLPSTTLGDQVPLLNIGGMQ